MLTDKQREYQRRKQKEYREARAARRQCRVCSVSLPEGGRLCSGCKAKAAGRMARYRADRVSEGRCPACGAEPAEGYRYCRVCLDGLKVRNQGVKRRRRECGICEACGVETAWKAGAPTCTGCKDRRQENENRTNRKRAEEGRCTGCGRERDGSNKRCAACRAKFRAYLLRARLACLYHYGRACACCGEREISFLQIDHVNGGGRRHREEVGNLYAWLRRNGFPEGFQTLCANCNWGKHLNDGVCPHQRQ